MVVCAAARPRRDVRTNLEVILTVAKVLCFDRIESGVEKEKIDRN